MKKILVTVILLVLVAQIALAQNGPKTAEETARIVDIIYQKLGPERAAAYYEPANVLVLSGRIPESKVKLFEGSTGYRAVASELEPFGLRLVKGGQTLRILSLDGLRTRFVGELPEAVVPWPVGNTLSDFESWEWSTRDKIEDAHGDSSGDVYYSLMKGFPNQAISARIQNEKNALLQETIIFARVPYSDYLSGQDLEFRVLSTDAGAPEVLNSSREWGRYLQEFYSLAEVRTRLNSPEFISARSKDKEYKPKESPREEWISGSPYGAFSLESTRIYSHHERVLAEVLTELTELVRANEPPYRWIALMNSKLTPQELSTPFNQSIMRRLIWTGAYPSSPARQDLYKLVAETRPTHLDALLEGRVKSWTEINDRNGSYLASETLTLFKHPRFRLYFAGLSAADRAPFLQTLEVLRDDMRVRLLLGESPYNGE